mgnify:CR=1 FL=1
MVSLEIAAQLATKAYKAFFSKPLKKLYLRKTAFIWFGIRNNGIYRLYYCVQKTNYSSTVFENHPKKGII